MWSTLVTLDIVILTCSIEFPFGALMLTSAIVKQFVDSHSVGKIDIFKFTCSIEVLFGALMLTSAIVKQFVDSLLSS